MVTQRIARKRINRLCDVLLDYWVAGDSYRFWRCERALSSAISIIGNKEENTAFDEYITQMMDSRPI